MQVKIRQNPITLDAIQWNANEPEIRIFAGDDANLKFKDDGLEVWNHETMTWENCPHLGYIIKNRRGYLSAVSQDEFDNGFSVVE